jgi:tetratricopeptide (TPR) repeat protein
MALKKNQEAENDFKKMIEMDSDNPTGYYRLGYLKSALKQFDQAAPLLEKAWSLNNKLVDVFTLRIRNAVIQKDFDTAHSLCIQQVDVFKDNDTLTALVHSTRANIYLAQKDAEQAESELLKAVELAPDYLSPYRMLANIYLARKNIEAAKKQYLTMIEKNDELAQPHMLLAVLLETENRFDEAEIHYRKALEINPNYAAAANNLSFHLASRTDKFDEALTLAKIAKARYPEDPSTMDTIGFAYYKKRLYGNAVAEFQDCLEKRPDNPIVRYHLGLAYYGRGEKEQALAELARALELNDNFPGANDAKKMIEEINKR